MFSKVLVFSLLGLAIAQQIYSPGNEANPNNVITESCSRKVDVAIIGAGATGAYAAYRLRNESLTIEVIEMSEVVGGRHLTARMPGVQDIPVELGESMFADIHDTVQQLVEELDLTSEECPMAYGMKNKARYHLRGQSISEEEIISGKQLPYTLTPEEKQNQGRIIEYAFEKLTGENYDPDMSREDRIKLETKEGKRLSELTFDEAMEKVLSPEGKKFLEDIVKSKVSLYKDASALEIFHNEMDYHSKNATLYKIKEGMDALPMTLLDKFLKASDSHNVTLNRKLEAIQRFRNMTYILKLKQTRTKDGLVELLGPEEHICAEKIILALPRHSLDHLQWANMKKWKVVEALNAVKPVPLSKVVLTFNSPFWLVDPQNEENKVKLTDTILGQTYDLGKSNSSDKYLLMASQAEGEDVQELLRLNLQGPAIPGSALGEYRVSQPLWERIKKELMAVHKISSIPEPLSGVAKFWISPPHIGKNTVWRAGYDVDDVLSITRHPSLTDKVYVANPDLSKYNGWTEGGMEEVDKILEKYF
ncbi:L-amino-acid oxidase-like [Physella acuta]|uniref:L-amino-acid oxidase-like n=1 Tax=Physella acuta TaxID=109671 RepID=UPI0027DB995E|nr:L-amino-acid oxidase-like [Physella acuta]